MEKHLRITPRWTAALVLGAALSFTPAVTFAETGFVGDSALTTGDVADPAKDSVVPNAGQYRYAKEELAAFCHFGPNTFSGVEWGENYGKPGTPTATEYMNNLKKLDADAYVKTIKDAGFKRLIVTAKHHDGFCIWDSPSTDYDMGSTTSKIDVLEELSKACSKYDLDMGLYLSPWDIHDKTYGSDDGDKDNYNTFYDGQLREILGNPKYGNKGKFVEVWMDGAKGSGAKAQEYDFDKWNKTIDELEGPECVVFQGGKQADVRWNGNELGYNGDESWNRVKMDSKWTPASPEVPWNKENRVDPTHGKTVSVGNPEGDRWIMPEADARITQGWFWHDNMKTPKSMTELGDMYFYSVGRGAPFLLNVPFNNQGGLDDAIRNRVLEFGATVVQSFDQDLTRAAKDGSRKGATAQATSVWQNAKKFGPANMLDGNDATYWSAGADGGAQSVLINLGQPTNFDVVSIEEAIQNGQRIDSFKVLYRNGDGGAWTEYGTGKTIGSKRLVRGPEVTATAVKIEMTTHGDAVPQLSEVGVFKAAKKFEAPSPIPAGMEHVDNKAMTRSEGWHDETGSQFIDGSSMWINKRGATAEFTFTGTRVMLLGTKDPGHGKANIYVDGQKVATVDTKAPSRQTQAVLWASDTLKPGEHRVKVEAVAEGNGNAIGIDAAATLNNGEVGMLDFDETQITMDEDSTYRLGITRTGGSKGALDVTVNFEPGSAVQGDFDTNSQRVRFADGETHKEVAVRTKRNADGAGSGQNGQFFVTMTVNSPNSLVLGKAKETTVTIIDRETNYTKAKLNEAIKEAKQNPANAGNATPESASKFSKALLNAEFVAAQESPSADAIYDAMKALREATEGIEFRKDLYSEESPFVFPSVVGQTMTMEGELGTLKDDTTSDSNWPLTLKEFAEASGGKVVDSIAQNDTVTIPFKAERAGTYKVVLRYMSGSAANKLVWADENTAGPIIEAGEQAAGNTDGNAFKTAEFTFKVKKPGLSKLVFTGPAEKSPRIDKLDITLTGDGLTSFGAVGLAGTGGTIAPEGFVSPTAEQPVEFTIAPNEGYRIISVTKGGQPVEVVDPVAPMKVAVAADETASADVEVKAFFEKVPAPKPDPEPEPNPQPQPDPDPESIPMTPLEPATPIEPEHKPQPQPQPDPESIPMTPLEPATPIEPEHKPAKPSKPSGDLPQTGDPVGIAALLSSASAAVGVLGAAIRRKR